MIDETKSEATDAVDRSGAGKMLLNSLKTKDRFSSSPRPVAVKTGRWL